MIPNRPFTSLRQDLSDGVANDAPLDRPMGAAPDLPGPPDDFLAPGASTAVADPAGATTVPFVDLARQHAPIREELREAFDRVLGASGFILGGEVEAFEAELAAYSDAAECVGVASGTAAITLALLAAGVGPGDEVVVPAHTYIASALGILHAGATPVFCDVEAATGLIDPSSAAAAVSERTAAVLCVHLYGQPCDMDALAGLAGRRGLLVLEDAAQAHGARIDGRPVGAIGAAGAFSFYPSKNLGALGDGGAICTDDPGIAERARRLRNLGQRTKGEHVVAGFNERLDGLQAALLRVKLHHLDAMNAARRELAAAYDRDLPRAARRLAVVGGRECVYHLYPVRVSDRDAVAERLGVLGVQTGVHYAPAVHNQPPFARTERRVPLAEAEAWATTELSLPMFAELGNTELTRVVGACAWVFANSTEAAVRA